MNRPTADISQDLMFDIMKRRNAGPKSRDNAMDRARANFLRENGVDEEEIIQRLGYSPTSNIGPALP
jgi:hypothetical protein